SLFSVAIACSTASGSQRSSGTTAAGLPVNRRSVKACTIQIFIAFSYGRSRADAPASARLRVNAVRLSGELAGPTVAKRLMPLPETRRVADRFHEVGAGLFVGRLHLLAERIVGSDSRGKCAAGAVRSLRINARTF